MIALLMWTCTVSNSCGSRPILSLCCVFELATGTVVHGKDSASEWDSQQICVVCMDAKRNALLSPCHHFCVCWKCAGAICGRKGECPVCRQIIREVVQVYVA